MASSTRDLAAGVVDLLHDRHVLEEVDPPCFLVEARLDLAGRPERPLGGRQDGLLGGLHQDPGIDPLVLADLLDDVLEGKAPLLHPFLPLGRAGPFNRTLRRAFGPVLESESMDQVGPFDRVVRNRDGLTVLREPYSAVLDAEQEALETPPLAHRDARTHVGLLAREALEVLEPDQGPVEPWRAHLEPIAPGDEVFVVVEHLGEGAADVRAVFEGDPAAHRVTRLRLAWPIDEEPDDGTARLGQMADLDQLDTVVSAHRLGEGLELFI